MRETTFVIGDDANCSDGYRGELKAVVIDAATRAVSYLAVEPKGRVGLARLVPLDLVDTAAGVVRLRCTQAEFMKLEPAEEILAEFVPGFPTPVQLLPAGWLAAGGPVLDGDLPGPLRTPTKDTVDLAPPGTADEHRGDHVHATDGTIGRVHAVRIDPGSRELTHVIVEVGHLWGQREVAIPAGDVAGFDDGIQLNITKQQVKDLTTAT
jgi:sporulation protein YlmC with PRC-barrel domain